MVPLGSEGFSFFTLTDCHILYRFKYEPKFRLRDAIYTRKNKKE
jgi:hypothetical protein